MARHDEVRGFTLLEILLVVAAIAILAGIVIVAINPARQLGETRNAQRRVDIRTILNAIQQYQLKYGNLPSTLGSHAAASDCGNWGDDEICMTDAASCSELTNLSVLTDQAQFVTAIPTDPQGSNNKPGTGTGYFAMVNTTNNRVVVCAPRAELDETIVIQQ